MTSAITLNISLQNLEHTNALLGRFLKKASWLAVLQYVTVYASALLQKQQTAALNKWLNSVLRNIKNGLLCFLFKNLLLPTPVSFYIQKFSKIY